MKDTGTGIPESAQEQLFDPFVQADMSITRKFGGTGLGLSICKKLAGLMSGSVSVESTLGEGSIFKLKVPVEILEEIPLERKEHPIDSTEKSFLKVLVVEDNRTNMLVVQGMLKKIGYKSEAAFNGAHALELCQKNEYDLILMDIQMPEMGGIEATQLIRKQEKGNIPFIIALTANAFDSDRKLCMDAGMNGFLTKPISKDKLQKAFLLAIETMDAA